jgi:hypothetical protein
MEQNYLGKETQCTLQLSYIAKVQVEYPTGFLMVRQGNFYQTTTLTMST